MLHTSYRFCHPHHPPRRTEPLPCTCSAPRTRPSTGIATAHQRPRLRPEARASGSSHPCLSFLSNCRTPTTSTLWQAFDLQHGTPARRGTRASAGAQPWRDTSPRRGSRVGASRSRKRLEDHDRRLRNVRLVREQLFSEDKTTYGEIIYYLSLPTLLARSCR